MIEKHTMQKTLQTIWLIVLYFAFIAMFFTIIQYGSFNKNIGFLVFKQDYISNTFWLSTFYIHVFSCFICLIAGATQFSKTILKTQRKLHKSLGKIYFYNILLINFPAGLILALYANGGYTGKSAFVLLDLLWTLFTILAVYWIKNGNVKKHQAFMIRSYALTLSAITFRLSKYIFLKFTNLNLDKIYIVDAWIALILNLAIAEMLIYRLHRGKLKLWKNRKKLIIDNKLNTAYINNNFINNWNFSIFINRNNLLTIQ